MSRERLRVLFAPDWRAGGPYQTMLAEALGQLGVDVLFPAGYRRVMPLARAVRDAEPDILHIHWPEAYCFFGNSFFDRLRRARLPGDVRLARLSTPLVLTAHNLYPHNTPVTDVIQRVFRSVHRQATAIIAHSNAARDAVVETHGVEPERVWVIPHGDLSVSAEPLPDRTTARERLGLSDQPVCLMFGRVEPYKGTDEIVTFWNSFRPPAHLCIVGNDDGSGYVSTLKASIGDNPTIRTCFRHVPDAELRLWLAACDCVLFNYQRLLTSGAASLARSYGIPILIPSRLTTVDLAEPDLRVFRFNGTEELAELLPRAIAVGASYESADGWRRRCSWNTIAEKTRVLYDQVLSQKPCVE